jgi:para-aminobenzoate synthetase/4-amino-4-deoxychorismate lyase
MSLRGTARPVRIALEGDVSAADACLLLRGDRHPFALTGAWAGGGALAGSEPLRVADAGEDPFALLDEQPVVAGVGEAAGGGGGGGDSGGAAVGGGDGEPGGAAVGGGWFGFLGYGLGARLEPVPPAPPRPVPLPPFALAFYDHLLRLDAAGRWWFEALWTEERDAALRARLEVLRARLAGGVRERPLRVGAFELTPPGAAGHLAAVAACRERIAAGEIFQANVCLRLEGRWEGDPLDLFARAARPLRTRHAALVAGPWGSLCSLSPELFLRRSGRRVVSEPIKGTAPRGEAGRSDLAASAKDRAENVMIVDLMRNDLGRVCEYGSVEVPALFEPRPAPGVWHLVSTVTGTLRPGTGDADLVRASFPPGSVTGAPKIQAMRVIAELEASGREAYTGAIGYASPLAGLELNVAIRTLEARGERIWLGAGGGIVADSDPARELEECLLKARPLIAAAGGRLVEPRTPRVGSEPIPRRALDGAADRPDPRLGVFTTMLVRDGAAVDAGAHLARLERSVGVLYGQRLPDDLDERIMAAAGARPLQRLRVLVGEEGTAVTVEATPLDAEPGPGPEWLVPVHLPGGLGDHKWRDRRLVEGLQRRLGALPLIVDLDGGVLEAATANVLIVEGSALTTPPLDGRLLPGTVRPRVLAAASAAGLEPREEPIALERLAAADELLLCSAIRGLRPAALAGEGSPRFEVGAALREALGEPALAEAP